MTASLLRRALLPLVLLLLFTPPPAAAGYKAEYRLSTVLSPSFPWGAAGERWAELVAQGSAGRIKIKLYPGVSLVGGDQTRELTALRQGTIDLAIGSTINWSPQVKELNLFALPFLMPDHRAIDALTRGGVGQRLFGLLEERGVVPLAWGENGFRELSNGQRPVRTPEELKGLKIRVVGSPLFIDTFTALGANPVQMSWADAQPAMATGAVDGQENPLSIFHTAKLWSSRQSHLTLWGYVADPLIFAVNRRVWEGWSEADRQVVREAAVQAAAEEVAAARAGIAGGDDRILKEIASAGVEVTVLDDAAKAPFRDATRAVYRQWAERIGSDLVQEAERAVAGR